MSATAEASAPDLQRRASCPPHPPPPDFKSTPAPGISYFGAGIQGSAAVAVASKILSCFLCVRWFFLVPSVPPRDPSWAVASEAPTSYHELLLLRITYYQALYLLATATAADPWILAPRFEVP